MSRSAIPPEHHAQLHAMRKWARVQGKTPPGITNAERLAAKNLAQESIAPGEPAGSLEAPAPEHYMAEDLFPE